MEKSTESGRTRADAFFDLLPYALALVFVALASSFATTAYERARWGDPAMMRASLDRYHAMLSRPPQAAPAGSGGLESGGDRLKLRWREAGSELGSAVLYLDSPPEESTWAVVKGAASLLRDGVSTAVAVLTVASWLYSRKRRARRSVALGGRAGE